MSLEAASASARSSTKTHAAMSLRYALIARLKSMRQ